jgi:hypothetical protein
MTKRVESRAISLMIGQGLEGNLTVCVNDNSFLRPDLGLYKEYSLNSI